MRNLIELQPKDATERDVTLTPEQAIRLSIPLQFAALALFVALHHLVWRRMAMQLHGALEVALFLLSFLLGVVAHEGLHAVGYVVFGRVPWSAIKIGMLWQSLMPYAHCREPITASAYRTAIALPGLLLGVLPATIGVVFGIGWLTVWGSVMFALASGDMLVLWTIRAVPGKALVRDHPKLVGCTVLL